MDECPEFVDRKRRECVSACESGFASELGACLEAKTCPKEYPRAEVLEAYTRCSEPCPDGAFTAVNGTCVSACPAGEFADGVLCVRACVYAEFDQTLGHFRCTSSCSYFRQAVVFGAGLRVCVQCDLGVEYYIEGVGGRECVDSCSDFTTEGHECVSQCPAGTVALGSACLAACPRSMVSAGGECVTAENKASWFGPGLAVLVAGFVVFGALLVFFFVRRCKKASVQR